MIQQGKKSLKEYRELELDSYSTLKLFEEDREKYYKKYVLGEKIHEVETESSKIGNIVEIMILEPDKVSEKLYYCTIDSAPSGKMGKFVEVLFDLTQNMDVNFEEAVHQAYHESEFQWNIDAVLKKFYGSQAEIYFKEKVECFKKGMIPVSLKEHQIAEAIMTKALENKLINDIVYFSQNKSDLFEVLIQKQIYGFEIDGLPLKSMLDVLIIDHEHKNIYIYDLKCTWGINSFYHSYYLKRKSYIQAYIYYHAAKHIAGEMNLNNYNINYPAFILLDSNNFMKPVIACTDSDDIEDAYNGFSLGERKYRGVKDIIKELKWCKENDEWFVRMDHHKSNGFVKLRDL
jgi:hypothetical protein